MKWNAHIALRHRVKSYKAPASSSFNYPISPIPPDSKAEKDTLQLFIDTTQHCLWDCRYYGYTMRLTNTTMRDYFFPANYIYMYITMQAQDNSGKWKDIEYVPEAYDNISFHTLHLRPNEYWGFKIPAYQGETKTLLRAKLAYQSSPADSVKTMYSNTIKGSVNPAQYWRKINNRKGYELAGHQDQ